jgi:hypothetical protein
LRESKINNENAVYIEKDGIKLVQFKNFQKYEADLVHCFTTRIGGVSTGECKSLNLGFNRNDKKENVLENYKCLSKTLGIDYKNMVFSNQVHDNKIKEVNEIDRGKGIVEKNDIIGYDGLITDRKNVCLVTFFADCVPVLIYDKSKKIISAVHSGWRGTVKEIAREAVQMMIEKYHSKIEDIEAAIGPSISKCCFEVGEEVFTEVRDTLLWSDPFCSKNIHAKWMIDLQGIIKKTLLNTGIPKENIFDAGICTKCNKDIFFSHRGDNGKTGSLAAIMMLK